MRPKEKKRGKNWLINSLLVLLFIIGLALIFNNQIRSWVVQQNSRSYAVSKLKPADVKKNMARETTFDFDSVESWGKTIMPWLVIERKMAFPYFHL